MPHIRIDNQPVTQITVIEPEPGKQVEALSLMTERGRFMARRLKALSFITREWRDAAATRRACLLGERLGHIPLSSSQLSRR